MQHVLAGLALAALALVPGVRDASQDRSPGVQRLTLVVEVDCARARELVWTLADAGDAEVIEVAAGIVKRRFLAMERSVRVQVDAEKDRIEISLPSIDPRDRDLCEGMLRSLGLCEFFFVADEELAQPLGIDMAKEREKLATWRKANPDAPLERFNLVDPAEEGPDKHLSWIRVDTESFGSPEGALGWPMLLPQRPEDCFGAASFARTYETADGHNDPAIGFELKKIRSDDFARFTEQNVGHNLAIVVGGKLVTSPRIAGKMVGEGLVSGRFDPAKLERWLAAFKNLAGPLRLVEIR